MLGRLGLSLRRSRTIGVSNIEGERAPTIIEPQVTAQVAAGEWVTVWAVLREQADISQAYTSEHWTERGQYVVDRLPAVASTSQG